MLFPDCDRFLPASKNRLIYTYAHASIYYKHVQYAQARMQVFKWGGGGVGGGGGAVI